MGISKVKNEEKKLIRFLRESYQGEKIRKHSKKKSKMFPKFSIIFSKINPPLSFYVVLDGPGLSLVVLRWSYVVL